MIINPVAIINLLDHKGEDDPRFETKNMVYY